MGAPRKKIRVRSARVRSAKARRVSRRRLTLRSFAFTVVTLDAAGREAERHRARAQQLTERLGKRASLEMVEIPAGTFVMGSPEGEPDGRTSERPQHHVTVPRFFLGKHAVTIGQWRAVMGARPEAMKLAEGTFKASGRQPVVRISFDEAEAFCARLSRKTGRGYRLPAEAEWEYACRAGTTTAFAFGTTISRKVVNYDGETIRRERPDGKHSTTRPVGSLRVANGFGLFDMHGNVWEWCEDYWHNNYQGAPVDGSARKDGESRNRVLRGGSWYAAADFCRAAVRRPAGEAGIRSRQIGFRVAMTARAE
jgi:formylglycine-generating enzyme required for sulfatase activity